MPSRKNVTLLGVPSATVAPHGLVFGSLSYSDNSDARLFDYERDNGDLSLVLGFGLGSAEEGVGLQVAANLTEIDRGADAGGFFSVTASRRLSAGPTPIYGAISVSHLGEWGESDSYTSFYTVEPKDRDPSASIAFTAFPSVIGQNGEQWPLMLTLGAGTQVRNDQTDPGIFAGVGVGLTETLGASVSWYGDYATVGAAFRPKDTNAYFTASLVDAFDQQDSQRVVVSLNFALANVFGR